MALFKLLGQRDHLSFLLPCYGFSDPTCADDYYASLPPLWRECAVLKTDRNNYVPRSKDSVPSFHTDILTEHRRGRNPQILPLCLWGKEKPRDGTQAAYHTALLVTGKRQFYHETRESRSNPAWWYNLMPTCRDCFTGWSRVDGKPFDNPIYENNGARAYTSRSGRGIAYGRIMTYDRQGQSAGLRTFCVALEFKILDRDTGRDNVMRINWVMGSQTFPSGPGDCHEPDFRDLDEGWNKLFEKVREGFEQHCHPVPPDVETWRVYFLGQKAKKRADEQRTYADRFSVQIERLDWETALNRVTEAWQLELVIARHCDSRFWRCPNYAGSHGENVGKMLRTHNCSPERREVLQRMVDDYVSLNTNIWNYVGD